MERTIARVPRMLRLSVVLMAGGCLPFTGFVYDEVLDGPYRLVAVDTMEQMVLCRSSPAHPADCVDDFLPSATVFAAGASKRYLVAARHPADGPDGKAKTEFFYVIRTADEALRGVPQRNVVGPLTEDQFSEAKRQLGLPEFSRTFEELR